MTDYDDGFDEKPSRDDAPDTCQVVGCGGYPEWCVRFLKPNEYLVYCMKHANVMSHKEDVKYLNRTRLR